ncbi:MAG: ATP-dependent zinc metalloprotease FtsH [Bacteroidales bacterium]|nr:ATP-dependent zinc metalloprotease FtsH [Bacteroidales bacterium]
MADKKSQNKRPNLNPIRKSGDSNKNKKKFNIYWVYGIIFILFLAFNILNTRNKSKEVTSRQFQEEMLKQGDVAKVVVVNRELVEITIKEDRLSDARYQNLLNKGISKAPHKGPQFYFQIASIEIFDKNFYDAQSKLPESDRISYSVVTRKDYLMEILGWVIPIAIIVAIWLFVFKRMSGGAGGGGAGNIFSVGKSKAKIFNKEESKITVSFKDVAGLQEAKVEVMEIVDFLKNAQKYTKLGGQIPKGALLVGPPGTGKTLLAKAVAGEANVPFFSMSGSDFVEMFVGVGASRVRDLFKQAKEKAPCIVFIDEIDAIGRARGRNPNYGANDERENTLNQLLTEMDGFDSNSGVIILAATNRADILDKALMRAGRFDRQIHVELPDLNERRDIFKVHLRPIKYNPKLDIGFFAKQTPGFSGAYIANVCNESALIAARRNKKMVERQDFLDAVDRIIGGLEKKNKVISPIEKKAVAYHEAGHATVSWLLKYAHPLVKVTIVPRGKALGAAWYLPEERQLTTTEQIEDEIAAALGGRGAEELSFGKISTGALNDLEKATKQAYAMVSYFGMSDKIGNISFYDSTGQTEYSFNKPYSEKTAELIDKEAKEIINKAYKRAKDLLIKHKDQHHELAELLLDREVIFAEDMEKIFGPPKNKSEELKAMMQTPESVDSKAIDTPEGKEETSSESLEDAEKKPLADEVKNKSKNESKKLSSAKKSNSKKAKDA